MKQSQLFTKTQRFAPKDEVSKSAQLLIRGGFIYKEMSGAYVMLPLGLKILNKIISIIREEMNNIGSQEITMTALQDKELWEKTNRWSDDVVDTWFKTKLKNNSEVGLSFTHEEPLTRLMKEYISSYRDLPVYAYQFQTKFRNEARAKSGIMRTREFIMKDLYSFSKNEKEHLDFYEKAKQAYINIFNRIGIGKLTYLTFASGGVFSKYSHEFQTISDAGEDVIYINKEDDFGKGLNLAPGHAAINKEIWGEKEKELQKADDYKIMKAVEVGNIFTLGTRFSEALGLSYKNESGEQVPVFMGSYGIGPARIMGVIAEIFSDQKGIIWPETVAPFKVHLISLTQNDQAEKIYSDLNKNQIEVLYDDREISAGEKFADADLIGLPCRLVISDKSLKAGGVELKKRTEKESKIIKIKDIIKELK